MMLLLMTYLMMQGKSRVFSICCFWFSIRRRKQHLLPSMNELIPSRQDYRFFVSMDSRVSPPIYHEHQVKQFCALHALNNLFGESCFTKKSLDEICDRLAPSKTWGNPHRSFFGFGNYDVNVIMVAVQSRNCEAIWWDKRNDLSELDFKDMIGLILNVSNDYAIGAFKLPLGRRHWISIRAVQTSGSPTPSQESRNRNNADVYREPQRIFYNLDSKFKVPLLIGNQADLITYLQDTLLAKGGEMLVIVPKISESGT